ncbi:MAG: hypothetical protein Q9162_007451 [Coniocarpon cinnabarinum]
MSGGKPVNGTFNMLRFHTMDENPYNNITGRANVSAVPDHHDWFMSPPECTYSIMYQAGNTVDAYLALYLNGSAIVTEGFQGSGWIPGTASGGGRKYSCCPLKRRSSAPATDGALAAVINQLYQGGNLTFDSVNRTFNGLAKETGWDDADHHDWKTSTLPILFNGLEKKPDTGSQDASLFLEAQRFLSGDNSFLVFPLKLRGEIRASKSAFPRSEALASTTGASGILHEYYSSRD